MDFEEYDAKQVLSQAGIRVPASRLATSPQEAAEAAAKLGEVAVKAQVATGKRGKAGGIRFAETPQEAEARAREILALTIDGFRVERLLIEAKADLAHEYYAAIIDDMDTRSPAILFSPSGGMDIEEVAVRNPELLLKFPVDIEQGVDPVVLAEALGHMELAVPVETLASFLWHLYRIFIETDAELLEINPLCVTRKGELVALDCKLTIDDSSSARQSELVPFAAPAKATVLEAEAAAAGLKYMELGGSVGVLANGAGLTMTTMDAIAHMGGSAANFLEIGGEAYTKSETALSILLKNPNLRCVLVNFCGAYARTDVMARGVVEAWKALKPDVPIFFTIHGTGEDEAVALVESELGIKPYDLMDDAVVAAVAAANEGVGAGA